MILLWVGVLINFVISIFIICCGGAHKLKFGNFEEENSNVIREPLTTKSDYHFTNF